MFFAQDLHSILMIWLASYGTRKIKRWKLHARQFRSGILLKFSTSPKGRGSFTMFFTTKYDIETIFLREWKCLKKFSEWWIMFEVVLTNRMSFSERKLTQDVWKWKWEISEALLDFWIGQHEDFECFAKALRYFSEKFLLFPANKAFEK